MDVSGGDLRYSSKLKHGNECVFDKENEREKVKEKETSKI